LRFFGVPWRVDCYKENNKKTTTECDLLFLIHVMLSFDLSDELAGWTSQSSDFCQRREETDRRQVISEN
jgi:hypothetical protein